MRARAGAHDAYILTRKITVFIVNGQIKPQKPSLVALNDVGLLNNIPQFGDKGYISTKLFGYLFQNGTHTITGLNSNMKNKLNPLYDKVMPRRRHVVETINDLQKNTADFAPSRRRSIHNNVMNLISAMGAYCYFDNKPTAIRGLNLEQSA